MRDARGGRRELRSIAAPFTVAAPSGARIRDRLRVSPADAEVLVLVGGHLGRLARADLAERVRIGTVPVRERRRAERKKALTRHSSSRWAGAITRASEDQYQLGMRCLHAERTALLRSVRKIRQRLAVPCGRRMGRVRGYADQAERFQKQRRLALLEARPAPRARGTTSPPRTPGTPREGGKSRARRGDQPALFPAPKTVRGATGPSPISGDPANNGQHR
ncbi:hypothetical protein ACF08N_19310 [Streptomyces sp. NPDC015127]|uniref:hypothetical protein n=1 Tax=Streptomyces sp. NPDC015127 TaxID=3364939 RepID=UPI0036FA79A0